MGILHKVMVLGALAGSAIASDDLLDPRDSQLCKIEKPAPRLDYDTPYLCYSRKANGEKTEFFLTQPLQYIHVQVEVPGILSGKRLKKIKLTRGDFNFSGAPFMFRDAKDSLTYSNFHETKDRGSFTRGGVPMTMSERLGEVVARKIGSNPEKIKVIGITEFNTFGYWNTSKGPRFLPTSSGRLSSERDDYTEEPKDPYKSVGSGTDSGAPTSPDVPVGSAI